MSSGYNVPPPSDSGMPPLPGPPEGPSQMWKDHSVTPEPGESALGEAAPETSSNLMRIQLAMSDIAKYEQCLGKNIESRPKEVRLLFEKGPIQESPHILDVVTDYKELLKNEFEEEYEGKTVDQALQAQPQTEPPVTFIQHGYSYIAPDTALKTLGKGGFGEAIKIEASRLVNTVNSIAAFILTSFVKKVAIADATEMESEYANLSELWSQLSPEERSFVLPKVAELVEIQSGQPKQFKGYLTKLFSGDLFISHIKKANLSLEDKMQISKCLIQSLIIVIQKGFVLADIHTGNMLYKKEVLDKPQKLIDIIEKAQKEDVDQPDLLVQFHREFRTWAQDKASFPEVILLKKSVDELFQKEILYRSALKPLDRSAYLQTQLGIIRAQLESIQPKSVCSAVLSDYGSLLNLSQLIENPSPVQITSAYMNSVAVLPTFIPFKEYTDISWDLFRVAREPLEARKAKLSDIQDRFEKEQIFALGSALFQLFSGTTPYPPIKCNQIPGCPIRYQDDKYETQNIPLKFNETILLKMLHGVDPSFAKLILQMVHPDPTQRPSANELQAALSRFGGNL